MTTGVFKGEIYMTPLHSPGPKIRVGKTACNYLLREPSYSHSNEGRQGSNLNDTIG